MAQKHQHFISTAELARHLGLSVAAVVKQIQKGQIKAVKIGRSYAIPRAYIEEGASPSLISKKEYISVMEAAQILGVHRMTIFERIKNGSLQAEKVGRHYVIDKALVTPQKDYVSVMQLAEILGSNRKTIHYRIKTGKIKATRIGRHYVVAREDIPGSPLRSLKLQDATAEQGASSSDVGAQNLEPVHYYSVADVAKQLGISRVAVFKRIKKGQMKAVRMGRSYSVPRSELSTEKGSDPFYTGYRKGGK